ncbi:unnamed protein product [Ilex paraguariensis]|uniref:Knottins-like domain-containing protein n=1 Tax=Ilex paraguariensis TaxID=185542 RepID=A0ABC8RAF0_9AQUA
MGSSMRLFPTMFLLLMLVMATGLMVAEARTCESLSHRFKGTCLSDTNCASVCKTEGFPGGDCRGFRRRCFCKKPC